MSEKEQDGPAADVSGLYGDAEAALASGMPVPSLRVLQAAGAIRAQPVAKPHGGFRRTWLEEDILKASIAEVMGEQFAWNIRTASQVLAKTPGGTWDALVATAVSKLEASAPGKKVLIRASDLDWHIDLVDRKFMFLKVPDVMTAILPDAVFGQTGLLLGMVKRDDFVAIPWAFGSPQGRATMKATLGPDGYQVMQTLYRVAMAARGNFLSTATVNASMQVRRTLHLLQGRKATFVQDMIQPRKRKTDP